jgi:hypothetical protein
MTDSRRRIGTWILVIVLLIIVPGVVYVLGVDNDGHRLRQAIIRDDVKAMVRAREGLLDYSFYVSPGVTPASVAALHYSTNCLLQIVSDDPKSLLMTNRVWEGKYSILFPKMILRAGNARKYDFCTGRTAVNMYVVRMEGDFDWGGDKSYGQWLEEERIRLLDQLFGGSEEMREYLRSQRVAPRR